MGLMFSALRDVFGGAATRPAPTEASASGDGWDGSRGGGVVSPLSGAAALPLIRSLVDRLVVTDDHARRAFAYFRRVPTAQREALLLQLGPHHVYRMLGELPDADARAHQELVEAAKAPFFGALLRLSEERGIAPQDCTPRFKEILAQVESGSRPMPDEASHHVYLIVPGLATEHQPGNMEAIEGRLGILGLTCRRSEINTDCGVQDNAMTLRAEVRSLHAEHGKTVVAISHSKGGPDFAQALDDAGTESLVHAFIAIQPAMASPFAAAMKNDMFEEAVGQLLKWLGAPDDKALGDLGFDRSRKRFEAARTLSVPTFTFASTTGSHPATLAIASLAVRRFYGVESDGAVPVTEQFVPGKNAHRAVMTNVDHASPVSRFLPVGPQPKHDQGAFAEALVRMGLEIARGVER